MRCFFICVGRGSTMPNNEEMENMTIWQNHEQRITTLEVNMTGLVSKMDSVEKAVKEGNEEQKKKLDTIDNRLLDEFFHKRRVNLSNGWKFLFTLLGGGSFLY